MLATTLLLAGCALVAAALVLAIRQGSLDLEAILRRAEPEQTRLARMAVEARRARQARAAPFGRR